MKYYITKGAYYGTTDDRADRWYIVDDSAVLDRRGEGYRTKQEALEALKAMLQDVEVSDHYADYDPYQDL